MTAVYDFMEKVLPFEWIQYDFMKNALLAVIIITPLFALLSTMIVGGRMAFFSDALGHSALAGIGIGVILGIGDTSFVTVIFAAAFALLLNFIKRSNISSTDTIIGVFSSLGVALGIILLYQNGNFLHYQNLFIGDILSVSPNEIGLLAIIFAITCAFWFLGYNKLLASGLNAPLARSKGIPVALMENLFAVLLALIVMLAIKWIGLLIINALLTLPAATSRLISKNQREYHFYSLIFSIFSGICGLIFSFYNDVPSGPSIAVTASIIFFMCFLFKRKLREL